MYFLAIFFLSSLLLAQEEFCVNSALEAKELLKNYKYSELEKKLEEVTGICAIEKYQNLHQQLAMVYIWKGKFDKAKPIVEKLTKEIEYSQKQTPSSLQLGKGRFLNILYANYTNDSKGMEKEILDFNDLSYKSQEAIFFYFLRKNDKRFLQYYGMRKQYKGDLVPLLCQIYCKKNNLSKDCPCTEKIEKKFEGGIWAIFKGYLDGEEMESLKGKIEKNYKEVPEFKKEILEILGIK